MKPDRSEIIEVIERDLDRCYPNHVMFREVDGQGQKDLGNLLKAYTFYNPNVGYAQGMGMVAGMFMMHMPVDVSCSPFPFFFSKWVQTARN